MNKKSWTLVREKGEIKAMARNTRWGILVRLENKDDPAFYLMLEMPKVLGLSVALDQALLQTKLEDLVSD